MRKKIVFQLGLFLSTLVFLSSCTTIRQGEVGVKRTFGKYSDNAITEGLKVYNPLTTRIIKISTQTENLEVGLNIPSKEGLNILSEVSILYNVLPKDAPEILRNIGTSYESNIILPVFRSAVADVSSRFYAKDMHTGERATIETEIRDQMMVYLEGKRRLMDAALLKRIKQPRSLAPKKKKKLEAEQQAQRMEFVLQQAKQEADQKRIEAEGIRDAQLIIAEGLDPAILQFKSIEAFMELSKSPNTKIIVTDGDLPMMMDSEMNRNTNNAVNTRIRN
ncbi:MAG: prohibitin family protein [Saprospiraceae bacterium]